MRNHYVLQVHFDIDAWRRRDFDDTGSRWFTGGDYLCGVPLWKPLGRPVVIWALDWVTSGEQKMVVFGPFTSKAIAKKAFNKLSKAQPTLGYRIWRPDDFQSHHKLVLIKHDWLSPAGGLPCYIWTDG